MGAGPMQPKNVLIIDDDPELLQLVDLIFSRAGSRVFTAVNGREGLRQFYAHQPDLVILDLMIPDMDGWEICRQIRQLSDVPLIMLTVINREAEIIRGLNYGADDYVTKPFNPEVLLARARATLRRAALPPPLEAPSVYNDGYLMIDLKQHRVAVGGQIVKLTTTEYRLLAYLFQNANQALTYQQILESVWGEVYQGNTEYVHVYIRFLRRKLEADPGNPTYLLTEHGVGYRFETQVPGQIGPVR